MWQQIKEARNISLSAAPVTAIRGGDRPQASAATPRAVLVQSAPVPNRLGQRLAVHQREKGFLCLNETWIMKLSKKELARCQGGWTGGTARSSGPAARVQGMEWGGVAILNLFWNFKLEKGLFEQRQKRKEQLVHNVPGVF